MKERRYIFTIAELIDRMAICQLKAVFIPEHKKEYEDEIKLIKHDISLALSKKASEDISELLHAVQVNMLANRVIWENESKARAGGSEQDKLLKFTHSVNGVRNLAKNVISKEMGERIDLKLDCLAADLCKSQGYNFEGIFNE